MKNIILASSSPRRKYICDDYGLNPVIIEPEIEEIERENETPYQIVMALAFQKAINVSKRSRKNDIVIASDTMVVFEDRILGKPEDRKDAFNILKELSGKKHNVITGIAVIKSGTNKKVIDYVETIVKFKKLEDSKIERYLNKEEYIDKAGAYGIQGYGQLLVESIKGSYLNVVGLPVETLDDILEEHFEIKML